MFQDAIRIIRNYTYPILISFRKKNGETGSAIGSFIILNKDGYILTAYHVVKKIEEIRKEVREYNEYMQVKNDETLGHGRKRDILKDMPTPKRNSLTHSSVWFGHNGWGVNGWNTVPELDMAVSQINNFDSGQVAEYPVFKNPSVHFEQGEMLCKLGFSLYDITPEYNEEMNVFGVPPREAIPPFPIEGIFTRNVQSKIEGIGTEKSGYFIETSSPGLPGQSGGPIFDTLGRVWGMQSHVKHHRFQSSQTSKKKDFLFHCGLGTHVQAIGKVLNDIGAQFQMSGD